jgi:hypothetical protein
MSNINTPETSVMFSLAELAIIEEERVEEETQQRAVMLAERANAERETLARRQEQEQARIESERDAEAQRTFAGAAAKARSEARQQSAVEVARIKAESSARLEADNAMRAHELAVLRLNNDSGRARLRRALAAVIGVVLLSGSAAAYGVNGHIGGLQQDSQRIREDRFALVQAHDKNMAAELMALDRRYDALQTRSGLTKAESARKEAAGARSAVDVGPVDQAKLRAFGESLDALDARLDLIERLAAHDRRLDDLNRWANSTRKSELVGAARKAGIKAHQTQGDDVAVAAYGSALDELAKKLVAKKRAGGTVSPRPQDPTGNNCTNPHDPLCGLNGQQIGLP